jgi:hypothetical protein
MVRSLFAVAALFAAAGAARSDDPPGPKIEWPEVKGLTRGKMQPYPDPKAGYSVPYNAPGFVVTVYVYNRGLDKVPDGPKSDEVRSEMKGLVEALDLAKQKGLYKSVKEVGKEETVSFGKGKGAPSALRRRFEIERKEGPVLSEGYVTGYKNYFVKIRASHDPDDKTAPDKIAALLESLGGALK